MHGRHTRKIFRLGLILVFLVSFFCLSDPATPSQAATAVTRHLPTIFGFGISAEPNSNGLGNGPTDTTG